MFLTQQDFEKVVKADNLTKILGDNGTLLADMILAAVAEANSYLAGRYDVAAAFAAEGIDRNPILVIRVVDMAVYHLHAAIDPRNVNDLRRDRYAEAINWLKGLSKGDFSINLPVKEVAGQTGYFLYGGNPKRSFQL
jgi:phage gp36-like protein